MKRVTGLFWILSTALLAIEAPSMLQDTGNGTNDANISVEWSSVPGALRYKIYYIENASSQRMEENVTATNFVITEVPDNSAPLPGFTKPLEPYTPYSFCVTAVDASDNESDCSDILTVKTLHTWHRELKHCLNAVLGKDAEHTPDRSEVESVTVYACDNLNINTYAGDENETYDELRDLVYVRELNVSGRIAGPFPQWITELDHLHSLNMTGFEGIPNSGVLPQDIGDKLPNLLELRLGGNRLVGALPVSIGSMYDLAVLELDYNDMNGTVPAAVGSLAMLEKLDLSGNDFNGTLPQTLSNLTGLKTLYLGGNRFESFPQWIGALNALETLDLSGIPVAGPFPDSLKPLTGLKELYLRDCDIRGTLPRWINVFGSLTALDLSSNALYGEIPTTITQLTNIPTCGYAFFINGNCNLFSTDRSTKEYLDQKMGDPVDCFITEDLIYYNAMLLTNTHRCDMGLSPVRMLLLD